MANYSVNPIQYQLIINTVNTVRGSNFVLLSSSVYGYLRDDFIHDGPTIVDESGMEVECGRLPKSSGTAYNVCTGDDIVPSTSRSPRSRRLNLRTSAQQEELMRQGARERGEKLLTSQSKRLC